MAEAARFNTRFVNRGNKSAEIWLYDAVGGGGFFNDGISARQFAENLKGLGAVDTINLHINSPGGDVFDGLAIYNSLKRHSARLIVNIDGVAASIAW